MVLTLDAINRFPVKSCRGHALEQARVEPWGLAGDRRWMTVDVDGLFRTAREHPRLLLVTTEVRTDGGLLLRGPGLPELIVPEPEAAERVDVTVWRSTLSAALAGADAAGWFTELLGAPTRLVHLDDPTRRTANPDFAGPDAPVSFADGYPLLLASSGSLDALNDLIVDESGGAEDPVPMIRFRPNVVVRGAPAWAEDGWRRVRIGDAVFRAVKGCDRCAIPMTDADTAVRGKEPIRTLARLRRWDGGTWFGMNLVPETPGASIAVGDDVEVLESVPAPDGPPR